MSHRFSRGRRRVHGAVQRDERPPLLLRLRHHRGEIEHRAGEAVELGDDERIRASPLKLLQRGTNTRTLQVLGTESGILDDLNDLPAAPLALTLDCRSLRFESGSAVSLFFATHTHVA